MKDPIPDYLDTVDATQLRALLLDAAANDPDLQARLHLRATAARRPPLHDLRKTVRKSLQPHDDWGWGDEHHFVRSVEDLALLFGHRIADEDPMPIELIEEAIVEAEKAVELFDETSCELEESLRELHRVHLSVCEALRPDPAELGRSLFRRQLEDPWGYLTEMLPDYLALIGAAGETAYWQAVEAAWEGLPVLKPDERDTSNSGHRSTIESIMEARVAESGDLDAQIRVISRNLSSGRRFHALARLCRDNGNAERAIEWLEAGLAAFGPNENFGLEALGIELYLEVGNHSRAEAMAWGRFERRPGSNGFFELLQVAESLGRDKDLREKALGLLWARVAAQEARPAKRPGSWTILERDHLVEIFLQEGDADRAWETFRGGAVSVRHWQRLAEARAPTHHDEAVELYLRLLPHAVEEGTRNARYELAVDVVLAMRKLRLAHSEVERFQREATTIRQEWRRKRNFIAAIAGL